MHKILKKVLKKITPTEQEKKKQQKLSVEIIDKIMRMKGSHVSTSLVGSNARDTHLRGDHDLDIFVFYPKTLKREEFEKEGLKVGKSVFLGYEWEKAYSEHPYIRGSVKGFDVEIVPAYNISNTKELQSAVDRTSFHNRYLQSKMSENQKQEVRLLKQFLKGIKAYGADLKVSSVPGYVTELLILKYGTFEKTIKAISKWRKEEVIDLENYLNEKTARERFEGPLIIVDPVDENRNVAAALSINQYARIIAASRIFLKKPSLKFFFGKKSKPLAISKVKKLVEKEGLIVVEIGYPKKELSDVLWGQIRSLSKKIIGALEQKDFKVLRNSEWSDEKNEIILIFDLEANKLEKVMKRIGPEVALEEHSEAFLKAHQKVISGPRIEKGRWVVEKEREHAIATKYIKLLLKQAKSKDRGSIKKALNKKT
ncbi:CCA tRNA nucleotidyltransferase, partial [archaeon]|nr:CCA tRNA nucleotidyltransferase [archaeon]